MYKKHTFVITNKLFNSHHRIQRINHDTYHPSDLYSRIGTYTNQTCEIKHFNIKSLSNSPLINDLINQQVNKTKYVPRSINKNSVSIEWVLKVIPGIGFDIEYYNAKLGTKMCKRIRKCINKS